MWLLSCPSTEVGALGKLLPVGQLCKQRPSSLGARLGSVCEGKDGVEGKSIMFSSDLFSSRNQFTNKSGIFSKSIEPIHIRDRTLIKSPFSIKFTREGIAAPWRPKKERSEKRFLVLEMQQLLALEGPILSQLARIPSRRLAQAFMLSLPEWEAPKLGRKQNIFII